MSARKTRRAWIYKNGVATFVEDLHVLEVRNAVGGRRHHAAIFEKATPGPSNTSVTEESPFTVFDNDTIEVVLVTQEDPLVVHTLHWGKVIGGAIDSAPDGDKLIFKSRLDDYMWSSPVTGAEYFDFAGTALVASDEVIQFNPLYDGLSRGNEAIDADTGSFSQRVFVHPDDTERSKKRWNLRTATEYLVEKFKKATVINQVVDYSKIATIDISNIKIPIGLYLSEALTLLLEPFGYQWFIHFGTNERNKRYLAFNKRGDGTQTTIAGKKPGKLGDGFGKTPEFNVSLDMTSKSFNSLVVFGNYERIEDTFTLNPAWNSSYDNDTNPRKFRPGSSEWESDVNIRRVFRDYVLNESGKYNGLRTGLTRYEDAAWLYVRSRRFFPCLTLDANGRPVGNRLGIVIEYRYDSSMPWKEINENVEILKNECGIRINNVSIPSYLLRALEVRVTASIYSDTPLKVSLDSTDHLILPAGDNKNIETVTLRERFHKQTRRTTSKFHGTSYDVDTRDDTVALTAIANEMLDNFECSTTESEVNVVGIDKDAMAKLGQVVTKIDVKNISMRRVRLGDRFPVVDGILYDFSQNRTTYFLDSD